MTTPGPLGHRSQQTLINLARMHAQGDTSTTLTRPNAVTLAIDRELERRGLVEIETTGGSLNLKTGNMAWTTFKVTITDAGLASVAPGEEHHGQ